MQNIKNEYLA